MMQSVLGNTSKVLIDQKAGNNLLYLPLDKLIQQARRRRAGDATATPRQPTASAGASWSRSTRRARATRCARTRGPR